MAEITSSSGLEAAPEDEPVTKQGGQQGAPEDEGGAALEVLLEVRADRDRCQEHGGSDQQDVYDQDLSEQRAGLHRDGETHPG